MTMIHNSTTNNNDNNMRSQSLTICCQRACRILKYLILIDPYVKINSDPMDTKIKF